MFNHIIKMNFTKFCSCLYINKCLLARYQTYKLSSVCKSIIEKESGIQINMIENVVLGFSKFVWLKNVENNNLVLKGIFGI